MFHKNQNSYVFHGQYPEAKSEHALLMLPLWKKVALLLAAIFPIS